MSEEFKEQITKFLDECEILPGVPTKDIDSEMWDDFWKNTSKDELKTKIEACQWAVMKVDNKLADLSRSTDRTIDDFRQRCESIEYQIEQGIELSEHREKTLLKCKLFKKLEEEKKLNVCPIAIDNSLSIAQAHDNQLVEKGVYEPSDLNLGVRTIERRCLDFPIEEDRIVDTPSGKTMRIVVGVNKTPDNAGRMGYVSIHELRKKINKETMTTISFMRDRYYNSVVGGNREIGLSNIVYEIMKFFKDKTLKSDIVYTNADSFLPDIESIQKIGFTSGDLIDFLHNHLNIDIEREDYWGEIGRETCVWARPTERVKLISPEEVEKAVETLDEGEKKAFMYKLKDEGWEIRPIKVAKDPAEYVENLEEMHKTSYETTPDIQNKYPYTTLLGVHTSSIFGWLEQDYNPYILQPFLANQLMRHIVEIDPEIGKLFLLNKIYEYQEMTPIEEIDYRWIIKFIEKFKPVKDILTEKDYNEIIEITGAQVGYYIFVSEYASKVEDYYDDMARRQAVYGIIDEYTDTQSGTEDNYIPDFMYDGKIDRMFFNTEMGHKLDEILGYTNIERTDLTWNTSWAIAGAKVPNPYDSCVIYESYNGYNEEEVQIESVKKEFAHVKNAEYLPDDFPLELFNQIMHDHLGYDVITDEQVQYYYQEVPTNIQIWTSYYEIEKKVMATKEYELNFDEIHNKLMELRKLIGIA